MKYFPWSSIEVFIIFVQIRHLIVCSVFLILFVCSGFFSAHAIGLGELRVQSGLGQSLQASVILLGAEENEISHTCIRVKVGTPEGVFLAQAALAIIEIGKKKLISMSTGLRLNEPAVKITVDISCEIQLHRDFLVLLDPPEFLPAIIKSIPNAEATSQVPKETIVEISHNPQIPTSASMSHRNSQKHQSRQQSSGQKLIEKSSVKLIKKVNRIKAEKPIKDVLRLSDNTSLGPEGLKISTKLSPLLEQQISENVEQIRLAQKRMAAMLQGDELKQPVKPDSDFEQKKILQLQNEADRLRNQNKIDNAYLDEIRKNSFSRNWVIGLASLVLLGLLIMLLLFVHVRRMQNEVEMAWWEQGRDKKEADRRKDIEEKVDHVQASYEIGAAENNRKTRRVDIARPLAEVGSADVAINDLPPIDYTQIASQDATTSRTPTLEESNTSTFNFFSGRTSSVKVEEISDITQEAEFWMSVNDPERAIEILNDQEDIEHPDSPVPWLYLLDLYRLVKNKPKYDSLRDRFVVLFNAHIPDFEMESVSKDAKYLEDFPHLIERICRTWNGNEIIPLLESLLVDDREGKRAGFELPVYRDILLLISIAHELEKMSVIEGPQPNVWSGLSDDQFVNKYVADLKSNSSLETIEFEIIDFPKNEPVKK